MRWAATTARARKGARNDAEGQGCGVIHGAGGDVGGAVARAFAREGARLFLSGRSLRKVEAVAADVVGDGGVVEAAQVDALDRKSTRLNSSHLGISYAVFCLKKKTDKA